jgi:hypothetical protein
MWNAILTFIKEFVERLQSESPKFFKTLRWICLALFIILTGLITINEIVPFGLDTIVWGTLTWARVLGSITTGIAFVFGFSYLPKTDAKKLDDIVDLDKPENNGG